MFLGLDSLCVKFFLPGFVLSSLNKRFWVKPAIIKSYTGGLYETA